MIDSSRRTGADDGDDAIELGRFYPELGIGVQSLASAMLGGVLITLMTWIQRASRDAVSQLLIAVVTGFLLAAPPLNHSVVGALEMLAGLFTGDAPVTAGPCSAT